jgi:CheY-like chemotaxis protein
MSIIDGLETTRRLRKHKKKNFIIFFFWVSVSKSKSTCEKQRCKNFSWLCLQKPQFVIVFLLIQMNVETMQEAFVAGIDTFMMKPFTLKDFLN